VSRRYAQFRGDFPPTEPLGPHFDCFVPTDDSLRSTIDFPLILAVLIPEMTRSNHLLFQLSSRRNREVALLSSVSMFWVAATNRTPSETSSWMLRSREPHSGPNGRASTPRPREAPEPGVLDQPVQLRPAGLGSAPAGIHVLAAGFPIRRFHFAPLVAVLT
jgi:hypothetical protein